MGSVLRTAKQEKAFLIAYSSLKGIGGVETAYLQLVMCFFFLVLFYDFAVNVKVL